MPLPVCHQLPAAAGGHLRPSWPEKTPDVDHQPAAGPVCTVLSVRFCAAAAVQHLGRSTERRDFYRLRFSAGAGAIEAYIERVSRSSGFEYGKARMFGCLGWALCATTAGLLFNVDPSWYSGWGPAAHCCWSFWWRWRVPEPVRQRWS